MNFETNSSSLFRIASSGAFIASGSAIFRGQLTIGTSSLIQSSIFTIGTSTDLLSFLSSGTWVGNISNIVATGSPITVISSTVAGAAPFGMFVSGRYAYVSNSASNSLSIFDVTNPFKPATVATSVTGGKPQGIYVNGRFAYTANNSSNTISMIDITNPAKPLQLSTTTVGGRPIGIYVSGEYAYTANNTSNTISVVDVSNPRNATQLATTTVGGSPYDIYVSGRYAYVANNTSNTISVVDVTNSFKPIQVATTSVGAGPVGVYVDGRYAYVANNGSSTMSVVDISNPTVPNQVATTSVAASPAGIFISGRYAYLTSSSTNSISIVDVSNPLAPFRVATGTTGSSPEKIFVSGRYAYVANNASNSISIIDIGGIETNGLTVGSERVGNLQVDNDIIGQGQLQVSGGANIGGALYVSSPSGTPSAIMGGLTIGSGTASTSILITSTSTLIVCARSNCTMGTVASNTAVAWFASPDGTQQTQSIGARGYISAGLADVGEFIPVNGTSTDYVQGVVVSTIGTSSVTFSSSTSPYDSHLAGVITTTAGLVAGGGQDDPGTTIIALAGRVPVNVTLENGPIHTGDFLTSSDIPGYAMRSTEPGRVLGMALEDDLGDPNNPNATSQVMMFVNPGWSLGSLTSTNDIASSSWALSAPSSTLDQFTAYIQQALQKLGLAIQDGVATLKEVIAGTVVTDQVCVQGACFDGSQLSQLMTAHGLQATAPPALPSSSQTQSQNSTPTTVSSTSPAASTSTIQTSTIQNSSSTIPLPGTSTPSSTNASTTNSSSTTESASSSVNSSSTSEASSSGE